MPFVRIEVIAGRTRAEKRALLDAVHQSLLEAFAGGCAAAGRRAKSSSATA